MQYGNVDSLRQALKKQHDQELDKLEQQYQEHILQEQQRQEEAIKQLEKEYAEKERRERQRLRNSLLRIADTQLGQEQHHRLQMLTARLYDELRTRFRTKTPLSTQDAYLKKIRRTLQQLKKPIVVATTTTYGKKLSTTVKKDSSITGVKLKTEHCVYDYSLETFFIEHKEEIHTLLLEGIE